MPGITAVIRQHLFSGFRETEDGEVYKGMCKELSGYGDKFQVFYHPEDAMEFITNKVCSK